MLYEDQASFYRTRFLMAHNRLHEMVHQGDPETETSRGQHWDEYLAELRTAEDIVAQPA